MIRARYPTLHDRLPTSHVGNVSPAISMHWAGRIETQILGRKYVVRI